MNYFFWILFVLMISQVCAICESGQIDINSASLTKLDELSGIGEILAGRIIEMRPFDSVEDLIEKLNNLEELKLEKLVERVNKIFLILIKVHSKIMNEPQF